MKTNLNNIKDSGFKVPKDYFNTLEASIMSNTKLKTSADTSGLEVPDSYFESLEDSIMARVKTEPKVISLFSKRNLIYVSSIAAAVVLMFTLINPNAENGFNTIEMDTIALYLDEEDLNAYEIAALLTEDELASINFTENDLSNESLENYLLENANIEDLIE